MACHEDGEDATGHERNGGGQRSWRQPRHAADAVAAGAARRTTRADTHQQPGDGEHAVARVDPNRRQVPPRCIKCGRHDQAQQERRRQSRSGRRGVSRPSTIPLMPEILPFSNANMPAAGPIETPPASADPGVKAFQSIVTLIGIRVLVRHQHRHRQRRQHRSGRAAEHALAQSRVAVAAHHDQVAGQLARRAAQHIAEVRSMTPLVRS